MASNTNDGVLQQRNKPVGKPRGMRRDRDCRSCKLRNVKCDLNRPSCGEVGRPSLEQAHSFALAGFPFVPKRHVLDPAREEMLIV
jgi:hypothetical protein